MPKNPNNDQSQTVSNAFPKSKTNRLPDHLINPKGIYSGIARRNAMEDGAFFPTDAPTEVRDKSRRDDS
jgi:hypothetical protein